MMLSLATCGPQRPRCTLLEFEATAAGAPALLSVPIQQMAANLRESVVRAAGFSSNRRPPRLRSPQFEALRAAADRSSWAPRGPRAAAAAPPAAAAAGPAPFFAARMRMRFAGLMTGPAQPKGLTQILDRPASAACGGCGARGAAAAFVGGAPRRCGCKVESLKCRFEAGPNAGPNAVNASLGRAAEAEAVCRGRVAAVRPRLERVWTPPGADRQSGRAALGCAARCRAASDSAAEAEAVCAHKVSELRPRASHILAEAAAAGGAQTLAAAGLRGSVGGCGSQGGAFDGGVVVEVRQRGAGLPPSQLQVPAM
ncbi:hypothetical protein Rsub_04455 [Raphidocelis subcapitata]|uniref:Uncharacterized protein n=1 Tax=Raphidocelis subcapitata TaxID=307507 RepID=A0A2V0NWU1_9CHLO|nr:hypothetical protein Rsub_04455 [Raphidocelis subcapitata]|eukprot:GBF92108.1 hypothetical protein Rsub_04455 [Raphidocelis subcapitata]